MKGERPTHARIDLEAIAANFGLARRLAGRREVLAVVKADAYGHGAVPVARRLVAAGCRRLVVATVGEAAQLRAAAVAVPILVLGGVHDEAEAADAAATASIPVVHHAEQVALLAAAARERGPRLAVQLEVDTGMRRMGTPPDQAAELARRIAAEPGLHFDGLYTHLACADDPDLGSAREQLRLFRQVVAALRSDGTLPAQLHVANSAALLAGRELEGELPAEVNAVRPGLMLYGVRPAPHLEGELAPAMSLVTRIATLRSLRPGDSVGYGETWRAAAPTRIATLPVGYADGVPWSLASCGEALHRGRRRRFAGRVSMDLVSLDVGQDAAAIGDEVVLFGSGSPDAELPVEEQAAAAGTIAYELLVRIGRRVPRVVIG